MIKRDGTKYIVMLEPRKTNIPKDDNKLYNIFSVILVRGNWNRIKGPKQEQDFVFWRFSL